MSKFLCMNLKSHYKSELDSVISEAEVKGGVYVLYGHSSLFEAGSEAKIINSVKECFHEFKHEVIHFGALGDNEISLKPAIYSFAKDFPKMKDISVINSFNGIIRKNTIKDDYDKDPLFLLCPPVVLDFANSVDQSLFSSLEKVQEFVIWYDNDLSTTTPWKEKSQNERLIQAWAGHGFSGWRYGQHHEVSMDFQITSSFEESLEDSLTRLCEYENIIFQAKVEENLKLRVFSSEPGDFINKLLDYLPAYFYEPDKDKEKSELVITNTRSPDQFEGAKVWSQIWKLDYYERQLLLDGWLTLWQVQNTEGQYLIQPASLALLYWAAKRSKYPKTTTPEEFMTCYFDYNNVDISKERKALDWFGGNI